MTFLPGMVVYGQYIGQEDRQKKDGSVVVMVGVAVGTKAYQVAVKPEDLIGKSWSFGDEVLFKVNAYAGQSGLYLTGYPVDMSE